MNRYFHDIQIALESILANKVKSALTALGIIFGVASVICMLAIGKGAKQEILEQIERVGVNNIIITPLSQKEKTQKEGKEEDGRQVQKKFSPGLHLKDIWAIEKIVSSVKYISPEVKMRSYALKNARKIDATLVGVSGEYFSIYNMKLAKGHFFTSWNGNKKDPVCIVGANLKIKLFSKESPIGKYIKIGSVWLKIIGVLHKNQSTTSNPDISGVGTVNDNIYVPVQSFLLRFRNDAVTEPHQMGGGTFVISNFGPSGRDKAGKSGQAKGQLGKIVVQVTESSKLVATKKIITRLLQRRHMGVEDFKVTVPELLLKQQQRTKDIFNFVLGAIASISLLVGGIGIMNIMFATVLERIKEIGIRLAIGAKKNDIIVQFLSEAVLISIGGGIFGVVLGIVLSKLVTHFTGILTIVSPVSVIIAFGISASVGIIFGYTPARKAAKRDPIESLRYE